MRAGARACARPASRTLRTAPDAMSARPHRPAARPPPEVARLRCARGRADGAVRRRDRRLLALGRLRHRHPHARRALAVAAGGDLGVLHLRQLLRSRGGDPARRPPDALGDHRGDDAARRAHGGRDLQPPGHPGLRPVHGLVRLGELPARLRQLPHAVADAARLVVSRDPGLGRLRLPVRDRAAGQRLAQRLPGARAAAARGAGALPCDPGFGLGPADHGRDLPRPRLSRRAGAVRDHGRACSWRPC